MQSGVCFKTLLLWHSGVQITFWQFLLERNFLSVIKESLTLLSSKTGI